MTSEHRGPYQPALDKARGELRRLDPLLVAFKSGATWVPEGEVAGLNLVYWGCPVRVCWPTGNVMAPADEVLSVASHLILLHYLVTADGTPPADRWLSFRDLPDGRVYDAAFRQRACRPLERALGARVEAFRAASERLGGQRLTFGDASFMFQVLPRVRVAVILHAGDDEFPAEATMLFDASLRHYLPIEDVAVLGGLVAGELVRARG